MNYRLIKIVRFFSTEIRLTKTSYLVSAMTLRSGTNSINKQYILGHTYVYAFADRYILCSQMVVLPV